MIVTLTDALFQRAREIADARQRNRERAGTRSVKQTDDRTEWETHFIGAAGEVAAESVLGRLNHPTAQPADQGPDMDLSGLGVAIKTREHGRQWACNPGRGPEGFDADLGLLIWWPEPMLARWNKKRQVILAGWFDRIDFELHAGWTQFGQAKRYAYPNEHLRPIEELLARRAA